MQLNILRYKNIAKDTVFYLFSSLIPMLLLVAINPSLAKNLSPQDYAIIGYLSSFATIITPLVGFFMMRYYFTQYFKVNEEERKKIKSTIIQSLLLFSLLMAIIVGVLISIYHYCFNKESTLPLFPYLMFSISAVWISGIYNFQLSEYRLERKSKKYFFYALSNGIIQVIFLLLLVVILKEGALGYLSAICISAFIFFFLSVYKFRIYIFKKIDLNRFINVIKFCWPIALAGCLEFFSNGYSRVLLERLGNNVEYGYYSVGNQFASYINVFTMALFTTFNPDLYEGAAKNDMKRLLKVGALLISVELITVSIFIVLAPFIIDILTAGRYVYSVQYARIISMSQIFLLLFYYINDITIAYGYNTIVLKTKIIASVLSVILISYIIGRFHYYGAAYGQVATYALFAMVNVIFLYLKLKSSKTDNYII